LRQFFLNRLHEIGIAYGIDMPNFLKTAPDKTDLPKPQKRARQRQPAIVVLLVTLFASSAAICAVLMIPILWVAVTDGVQQSRPTYQQCGLLKEDANRLACYDDVSRQISLRSAKDARRMTFGELLAAPLSDPARNTPGPKR
jgi:hypothetical protein